MSNESVFPIPLVTGEAFVFYVRETSNDVLIDFSTYTFKMVIADEQGKTTLFTYTDTDAGVFSAGSFTLVSENVSLEYNLAVQVPHADTLAIRNQYKHVHLGMTAYDATGTPVQLIPDAKVRVVDTVSP